jgi:hypothetical protein
MHAALQPRIFDADCKIICPFLRLNLIENRRRSSSLSLCVLCGSKALPRIRIPHLVEQTCYIACCLSRLGKTPSKKQRFPLLWGGIMSLECVTSNREDTLGDSYH